MHHGSVRPRSSPKLALECNLWGLRALCVAPDPLMHDVAGRDSGHGGDDRGRASV